MIGALFALALLVQEPVTAEDLGRKLFLAGMCGEIGFELDREEVFVFAGAAADASPNAAAFIAESMVAVDAYEAEVAQEVAGVMAALENDPDAGAAWGRLMVTRCDALAAELPQAVRRTPESEPRIRDWVAGLAG
jgi:hypothetical protein